MFDFIINKTSAKKIDHDVQSQKLEALGQFAGGIAHDFNNILSIIEGYVYIAIKKMDKGELKKDDLEKILKSTEKGSGLTRQLLSFGKMKVDVEEKINLAEALKEFHVLLRPALGEKINLFMTIPEHPVWVTASKDQITQILLNLSINSRDAMPKGGDLSIIFMPCREEHMPKSLSKKYPGTNFVRMNVTDNGEGIPESIFSKIFDPFFTTKDQSNGVGLGLSVVYGIVNQLLGGIEVSSQVGGGTSFDIYLPIATPPENAFKHDVNSVPENIKEDIKTKLKISRFSEGISNKTILIAEDEPELRHVLEFIFRDMDMNVLTAENGNKALLIQDEYEKEIDFLLTDVVMPEMDGIRLGELFKSVRPNSEVIYMSGYPFLDGQGDIKVPEDAIFISKPLHEDKVKAVLERAVQRRKERMGEEE